MAAKQSPLPQDTAAEAAPRDRLSIVVVGHVDHGKSTLIGRLFHDTDSLPEGKYEQIRSQCEKRGMPFEWSFLLDALQAERDQGITIDTTQIWFKTARRDYVIIDAPGHKEFLKNMVSGAANSEAALLIIDAEEGVREQSKRHGYLLHLLGVRQVAVAVNKMDRVGYSEARYREIVEEYGLYLQEIGVKASYFIPISAREGDMIANRGEAMGWYDGPTITEALDSFQPTPTATDLPLRFPVQDVYKFDERRIIAGRIESGSLRVGDTLLFSPSSTRVQVRSIEQFGAKTPPQEAHAGQSVGITLSEQIFVERGHVASHESNPPVLTNLFRARIFWLGRSPLVKGKRYKVKINTGEFAAELREVERVIDTDDLAQSGTQQEIERNQVGEVMLRLRGMASLDPFEANPRNGRFVILDGFDIAGGGIIDLEGIPDQRVSAGEIKSENIFTEEYAVSRRQRARASGHQGGILWLTGLSGSGKSTLAKELEKKLFAKGYHVYVLDGDNVRHGLSKDLGFAAEDRSENIRRVGEVAALFADAGMIVITAFISPYSSDRKLARNAAPEFFNTVYVKADLETCEQRDVKGLYAKARAGKIENFTGISDPYEEPEMPDLVVDTSRHSVEECIAQLEEYVECSFVQPVREAGN